MIRTIYGERPITQLYATLVKHEDLADLVRHVRLTSGKPIEFEQELVFREVMAEAPLGASYGNVDLLIETDQVSIMVEVKPNAYEDPGVSGRLEKQIPQYLSASHASPEGRQMPLVRRSLRKMSTRRTFLIAMTGDERFPKRLMEFLTTLDNPTDPKLGWTSYSHLEELLSQRGHEIEGTPPHIWLSWFE